MDAAVVDRKLPKEQNLWLCSLDSAFVSFSFHPFFFFFFFFCLRLFNEKGTSNVC